jgi:hypothetical protein
MVKKQIRLRTILFGLSVCVCLLYYFVGLAEHSEAQHPAPYRTDMKGSPGFVLEDENIRVKYAFMHKSLKLESLRNKVTNTEINSLTELFVLLSDEETMYSSSTCTRTKCIVDGGNTHAVASFACGDELSIEWSATIVSNEHKSSYLRQSITLNNIGDTSIKFREITMLHIGDVSRTSFIHGSVEGSPAVDMDKGFFFGLEQVLLVSVFVFL